MALAQPIADAAPAPLLAIVEKPRAKLPYGMRWRRGRPIHASYRRMVHLTTAEADLLSRHAARLRRAAAVASAVWLGANTARRLALEWGTTDAWAETHLRDAERRGHVHQLADGRFVGHMNQTP